MFDEFAKAIIGSNGTGDNIYRNYNSYKTNASEASVAGNKAKSQAAIDEQNRQNAAEIAKKTKDVEDQAAADAADPSKAQMIMKPDRSGYYFLDGTGKQMNINKFSLLTGKRPDELLADSDNPRDQQFVQDYKTMKEISNAWVNGDNETLMKYRAADPEKFNQIISNYKSPSDMVRGFMDYYNDFYNDGKTPEAGRVPFSPGNVTAPSKSDTKKLGASSLGQTLAPAVNPSVPAHTAIGSNPAVWAAEHIPLLNRLTGRTDELNRQKEKINSNPWNLYHNRLLGR